MKKRDIAVVAAALLAALALYLLGQASFGDPPTTVVVTVNGEERLRVPLAVEETYEIRQEDGALNVLQVSGGAARMLEANCRDGLCVAQGAMRSRAKTIVCLPHGVVVRLEGGGSAPDDGLDVII